MAMRTRIEVGYVYCIAAGTSPCAAEQRHQLVSLIPLPPPPNSNCGLVQNCIILRPLCSYLQYVSIPPRHRGLLIVINAPLTMIPRFPWRARWRREVRPRTETSQN